RCRRAGLQRCAGRVRKFSPAIMVFARPGSEWSMKGHRPALARLPACGKCSGTMCVWRSMIIGPPFVILSVAEDSRPPGTDSSGRGPENDRLPHVPLFGVVGLDALAATAVDVGHAVRDEGDGHVEEEADD